MCGIKEKDGTITKCRERIMETTKEFYQEVLCQQKPRTALTPTCSKDDAQKRFKVPPVTTSETHRAINQLIRK